MKKILFFATMAIALTACSDDDKPKQATGCQMKVLSLSLTDGEIKYGVSWNEYVTITVSSDVAQFYYNRTQAGTDCWIGEVTHE